MEAFDKKSNSVLAIVVSFNGYDKIIETVVALIGQVDYIIVLDNGSNEDSLRVIRKIEKEFNTKIIYFGKNVGIGEALNYGVKFALEHGFNWVLTMDQDSVAHPEMVTEMLATACRHKKLSMVSPSIFAKDKNSRLIDEEVGYVITSGNLIPIGVFSTIGLYNERYFIDSVDFEFCLRAKNSGIVLLKSGKAFLSHELGKSVLKCFFGFSWLYVEHSPIRRYYIYRNHFRLAADYFRTNPLFVIKKTLGLIFYTFEISVFDNQRIQNFSMIRRGIFDYFRGRSGPLNMSARK